MRSIFGTAMVVAMSASLVGCTVPPAAAIAPPCQPTVAGSTSPLQSSMTADADATTIPDGVIIASAPSNNLTAIGGQALVPDSADTDTYMFNWKYPPHGVGPTPYPNPRGWAVQLMVAGTKFLEFQVYARPKAAWTMTVDGQPATDVPATEPATTNGRYLIKYALPDTGEHHIRFAMNNLSLGSVFADAGSRADAAPVDGPRVFFLGDSLTQGGAQSTGGEIGSWIWKFSQMCGFDDVWNGGIGGTGAIVTGADGLWADYATRVNTDVAPANPGVVFITSYYGDRRDSPTDISTAFARAIEAVRALPARPTVIVTGAYDPTGRNDIPYKEIDQALSATCASLGVPYVEPRTGNVYDSTGLPVMALGLTGPWITAENKGIFIGADGVHQTDEGQRYMAQRLFDAYRSLP